MSRTRAIRGVASGPRGSVLVSGRRTSGARAAAGDPEAGTDVPPEPIGAVRDGLSDAPTSGFEFASGVHQVMRFGGGAPARPQLSEE